MVFDHFVELAAVDQLHDDEGFVALLTDLENLYDIWAIYLCGSPSLPKKVIHGGGIASQNFPQYFDGDLASELGVIPQENGTHSAFSQKLKQQKIAKFFWYGLASAAVGALYNRKRFRITHVHDGSAFVAGDAVHPFSDYIVIHKSDNTLFVMPPASEPSAAL